MKIIVNRRDVIWGYVAMVFNYGAGFLTLPFILSMLTANEVGMNYIMLTISNLVALADFGFSHQIGRNITYVFSGAKSLKKEGISDEVSENVDFHLIAVLIKTARFLYLRIALLVAIAMLTLGTWYMWGATQSFTLVNDSLMIWILFVMGAFFSVYYKYYTSLLLGAAQVMEYNKGIIYSKILYIVIVLSMLFCGFGLLSVVVAGLISPFIQRWLSYRWFYSHEVKQGLKDQKVNRDEVAEAFTILWYNAKRLGLIFIAQYGISQSGIFFCGLMLPLSVVASYGLLMQLVNSVLCAIAKNLFNSLSPLFNKDMVKNDNDSLLRHFSLGNTVFWVIFIVGGLVVIFVAPWVLKLIGSDSQLPSTLIMVVFITDALLDYNHSNFTYIPMARNEYPFLMADMLTGVAVVMVNALTLYCTSLGLLGIVFGRFVCMLAYNDWKWPLYASKMLGVSPSEFVLVGWSELHQKFGNIVMGFQRRSR